MHARTSTSSGTGNGETVKIELPGDFSMFGKSNMPYKKPKKPQPRIIRLADWVKESGGEQ